MGAKAIAAGDYHALAIKSDNTVAAWGYNRYGQCNIPEGLSDVTAISAGSNHSLALKSDGTVVAWGYNGNGQYNIPEGLSDVTAISARDTNNLALKSDGTVVVWGLGTSNYNIPSGLVAIAVSAGYNHNLALKSDGTVVAWGNNNYGQRDVPIGLNNVIAVSAGNYHSLALKSDGTVVSWGSYTTYNYGQFDVPEGLSDVVAISAGEYHNLALKSDGTVVAWGRNDHGQCSVSGLIANVLEAGETFSLALRNGTVVVLGDGSAGQYEIPNGVNPASSKKTIATLPIGSKVKFGQYSVEGSTSEPIIWVVGGHNRYKGANNLTITNHTTLITEKLIDTKGFDAIETGFNNGNYHYNVSNIRQWLNSTGVANSWYVAQHENDQPPTYEGFSESTRPKTSYDNENGFLHSSNFSEDDINVIVPTVIEYDDDGKGGMAYVLDNIFLLDYNEVDGSHIKSFCMFSSDESRKAYFTQQAFNNGAYVVPAVITNPYTWWLRRVRYNSYTMWSDVWTVGLSGSTNSFSSAYTAFIGLRPATNITANALVSDTPDADGCYTIIGIGDIFEWTYPKIAKQPLMGTLTYDEEARVLRLFLRGFSEEWAAFQIAINKKRTKYGLSNYAFTTIIAGTTRFGAGIFNETITAINEIYTAKGEASQIMEEIRNGVQGRTQGVMWKAEADYFNNLRDALNNA